jgi:hypothetical protein
VRWFKKYGVKDIIPCTNYIVKKDLTPRWIHFMPHSENLSLFQKAAREFIGKLLL